MVLAIEDEDWVLLIDSLSAKAALGLGDASDDGSGTRLIEGETDTEVPLVGELGLEGCFRALRRGGTNDVDMSYENRRMVEWRWWKLR